MTNVNLKINREISSKVYLNHLFLILLNVPLRLPVFLSLDPLSNSLDWILQVRQEYCNHKNKKDQSNEMD